MWAPAEIVRLLQDLVDFLFRSAALGSDPDERTECLIGSLAPFMGKDEPDRLISCAKWWHELQIGDEDRERTETGRVELLATCERARNLQFL